MDIEFKKIEIVMEEIHQLCTMRFLNKPAECYSYLFPFIVNRCEDFWEKLKKQLLLNEKQLFEQEPAKMCANASEQISSDIMHAYHSVWMAEMRNVEDVYFLSNEQAQLLDWDNTGSPYRELHRVSEQYYKDRGITSEDVVYLFNEVVRILKADIPPYQLQSSINLLFSKFFIFLTETDTTK